MTIYNSKKVTLEEFIVDEGNKKVHKLMYHHQIRFSLVNAGKSAMKDVIFSIKDVVE